MLITGLTTDSLVNPIGHDGLQPLFCWRLESSRQGARQTAYQIGCATSEADLRTPNVWNSGRVESDVTTHVPYKGSSLISRQRVYWRVRVWDETGAETVSEAAFWEMGLLSPHEWQAQWIGGYLSGTTQSAVPAPYLRLSFSLSKPIRSARLYTTALGLYEAELNGQRVGDLELTPGWQDYQVRVQYQTYDVTSLLQEGENAWGVSLGSGWYCGHVEWRGRQRYGGQPKYLGQLEVVYIDGSSEIIATDGSWRTSVGAIIEEDLLMGQTVDGNRVWNDWTTTAFDDSSWQAAQVFADESTHARELCAPLGPPVRVTEEIAPIAEPRKQGGEWIFDLGQNMVGRIRLKVSGPRGVTVRIRYAETLEGGPAATEGPIYTTNLRSAKQTDYYVLRGEGEEIFEPKFTFHGFRYVELHGFPGNPTVETVTGVVLHSDTPRTGDFECSDPLVNQLQKNIDWGWRGNSLEIPTDCPQRDERLGWTGDAQVFVRTAAFNRGVEGFFREWARDARDSQNPTGGIPAVIPNSFKLGSYMEFFSDSEGASLDGGPAWADAVLICPWTIYRCYGDKRVLEENYDVFTRFIDFQFNTSKDNLRCYEGAPYFKGFGDWLAIDGSGRTEGGTPKDLIGTAFLAHGANLMSQIATVLGKTEDAAKYAAQFEEVKSAFCQRFVTPAGLLSPPYQTPYLLALHFNLLPEELRAKAAKELVIEIKNRGNKLSTGFVGSPYINLELTREGHNDVAYGLLFQQQWPSWLYAVTQGATTIWERWDGWTHDRGFQSAGMNSFNHYAYGAVGAWLYQVVAGIELDPIVPGYKKFQLKPQPGPGLTSAKAHLDTLHGRIESAWTLEGNTFSWKFTVPPNTTATVTLPNGESFEAEAGRYERTVTYPVRENS